MNQSTLDHSLAATTKAILYCVVSLLFYSHALHAQHGNVSSVNPAVSVYFKYRDNHQAFKQIRASLVRHVIETQQVLPYLERDLGERSMANSNVKTAISSQLESKLSELSNVKQELQKLSNGHTRQNKKKLISSLEKRVDRFSQKLHAVKKAKSQSAKRKALNKLKAELELYNKLKLCQGIKAKSALELGGWNFKPTPGPVDPSEVDKNVHNGAVQKQDSLVSHDQPTEAKPSSWVIAILDVFLDTLIPNAAAQTYQQPVIQSGVSACYDSPADYSANIDADLDLSQQELEVDTSLDAKAYEQITSLAAQLDYSPVKILEYVTNNLEHEHYSGSMKGALGALDSGGANDFDHASLLIALLRASSIPARYVRGNIYFQDKPEHLDWWNVKDIEAAYNAVFFSRVYDTPSVSSALIDGLVAFSMQQIWVEACVPYGDYRGDKRVGNSHRWVPLDASFKRYERTDGIEQNEPFDSDTFLAQRTKQLPHEAYEEQVLNHIRTIDPNLTLEDVGTRWEQRAIQLEFLPDTLPYPIKQYTNWGSGIFSPRSATLPDNWRTQAIVDFSGQVFTIPMADFAQHRITLSFEAQSAADSTTYLEFMDGDRGLSCPDDNLTLKPVFKKDGIAFPQADLNTVSLCDGGDYRDITMSVEVKANGGTASGLLTFDTISPLEYYALNAYAFNASNHFLQERNERLLTNLNNISKPSDNPEETIGEFLHLVMLKYMGYTTEANRRVGQLLGGTGRTLHAIGVASSRADVSYLFDLPYAVQSNNFVIDVPGAPSISIGIQGGEFSEEELRLAGYSASNYESYIWQEMALKDAVSTVSGLQIAADQSIDVQSFTSADALNDFVTICGSSVSTDCYSQATIDAIKVANFPANTAEEIYSNKVIIPQTPLQYGGWQGYVYIRETIATDPSGNFISARFSFPIDVSGDSFSGGYTVPTLDPILFSGFSGGSSGSSSSESYSTGYNIADNLVNILPDWSTDSIACVGSGVCDGVTDYVTAAFDPVNMVTGNMYHEETDINVLARGLPLVFKRFYNSRSPQDGPLGWGWTHSFNQTLEFKNVKGDSTIDTIVWTNGTGSQKFIDVSAENRDGGLHILGDVVQIPDGFYFTFLSRPYGNHIPYREFGIAEKNGITYYFEGVPGLDGDIAKLTRIVDANDNQIQLSYTDDRLTTITDEDNRTMTFAYDSSSDRIKTVTLDWANEVYEYFYDGQGHLTGYRNPLDRAKEIHSSTYVYYSDSDGHNLNHRMKSFGYANGYKMTFEYYANGKTYRHYNAKGETATFTYNDFRREAATTDELGRVESYIFNENGLPSEITDALGGKERYYYEDPNDPFLRTRVVDAMGYETQTAYDTDGNITQTTLPSGHTVTYNHYNTYGQPQLIKNALDHYTLQRYDTDGNLTDTIVFKAGFGASVNPASFNPEANSTNILSWTQQAYDVNGKVTSLRRIKDFSDDSTGPYTEFDYTDSVNNTEGIVPTSVSYFGDVNGDGAIGTNEGLGTYASQYDAQGRLIEGFDRALYPVTYRYDADGRVLESTDPLGGTRTFQYDDGGLVTGQSLLANQNGQIVLADNTLVMYDAVNRPIATVDSSGAITNLEYDEAGNLIKSTSPDGYSIFFEYDAQNRVTTAYDEEGHTVQRKLDLVGRVKQLIDPNGHTTDYSYYGPEHNGRVKRITDAEGRWTEFSYDALGQVTQVVDNAGRETLSQYDALGRVVRVVSPSYDDIVLGTVRPVTTYQYNTLGHQTAIYAGYTNAAGDVSADSLSLQERYEYDDFGRLLKRFDAANHLWEVTEYDVHGNVKASRDPLGHVSTFTYGHGGVLTSQSTTGPGGASAGTIAITYERNGLGQPKSITSPSVSYTYEYDTAHRLKKVTDSRGGKSIEYDYSVGGLLNSIRDNHGNQTAYLYDPVGRLTGIRGPDNGLISYVYDAGGRLQQKVFPNNLVTAYEYFKDNQVKSIVTTNTGGSELLRHAYTYNSVGEPETASHTLSGVTQNRLYEYDGLGRLTKERDTTNNIDLDQIAYDPYGNRRQRTVGGSSHFYSHNNLHQIHNIRQGSASGSVLASFAYDVNGNMTSKTSGGVTTALSYDALDRVVNVSKTGFASEQYTYDHSIRRISKAVGTTLANYHYSGPDIMAEYGSDWTAGPQAVYAHGAAMDDPLLRMASNDPRYYHGDALGSIVGVSNHSGSLTATNRYDAWGAVTESAGTTETYGYTGREPSANGLIYYRARYYDPEIGRFTQADPKGYIDGINKYTYAINNPIKYIDPWGTSVSRSTQTGNSGGYLTAALDGLQLGLDGASIALDATGVGAAVSFVPDVVNAGISLARGDTVGAGLSAMAAIPIVGNAANATRMARTGSNVANEVPNQLARVVPDTPITRASGTLGRPDTKDVFVTAIDDIRGLDAAQIAERLTIPQSPTGFRVIEFPTPTSIASPINRADPGFIGGGRTAGGAREFVIPNGPIPANSTTRVVR